MALNNLAENAERLTKRIGETIQEQTREFTRATSGPYGGGSSLIDSAESDNKPAEINRLLESNSDRDKLYGLKRVVALMSKNRDVSSHFAHVVKNVAGHNLESEPDLALLSVNTFQKDLSDTNPLIRAVALRVLTGISVPMIASIVLAGIKKCASDPSPYVRKAAAHAIPKCYHIDPSYQRSLLEILVTLLADRSPLSTGSIAHAFTSICPDRFELLHPHYRRLCRALLDADEWGQVYLLNLLGRYARGCLAKPEPLDHDGGPTPAIDQDLELLLECTTPLLQSRNPAVVLAAVRTFYGLSPPASHAKVITPLLRLLRSPSEVEYVTLEDVAVVAAHSPALLREHASRIYIRAHDRSQIKRAKMRVLVRLIDESNAASLLREFKDYVVDTDDDLVADAIWAIGRCAQIAPDVALEPALLALTMLLKSSADVAVATAVQTLRLLRQSLPATRQTQLIVPRVVRRLDAIRSPGGRASVLWMVGQYSRLEAGEVEDVNAIVPGMQPWAPDVLRKAAQAFKEEANEVKLQTLTLAAKLFTLSPSSPPIQLLARYVFSMARYDLNNDVRDRGRFLVGLLRGVNGGVYDQTAEEENEVDTGGVILRVSQVMLVLFEGKSVPDVFNARWSTRFDTIGSMSILTGREMDGSSLRTYPAWPEEGTESSLRDTPEDLPAPVPLNTEAFYGMPAADRIVGIGSTTASRLATPVVLTPTRGPSPAALPGPSKGKFMDLDDFYKDDAEDEEGSSDDEGSDDATDAHRQPAVMQAPAAPITSRRDITPPRGEAIRAHIPINPKTVITPAEDPTEEDEEEDEEDAFLSR